MKKQRMLMIVGDEDLLNKVYEYTEEVGKGMRAVYNGDIDDCVQGDDMKTIEEIKTRLQEMNDAYWKNPAFYNMGFIGFRQGLEWVLEKEE